MLFVQDLIDNLVSASLLQMPGPGVLQDQTLQATFLHEYELSYGHNINSSMLSKILSKQPMPLLPVLILVTYGGNTAR